MRTFSSSVLELLYFAYLLRSDRVNVQLAAPDSPSRWESSGCEQSSLDVCSRSCKLYTDTDHCLPL